MPVFATFEARTGVHAGIADFESEKPLGSASIPGRSRIPAPRLITERCIMSAGSAPSPSSGDPLEDHVPEDPVESQVVQVDVADVARAGVIGAGALDESRCEVRPVDVADRLGDEVAAAG
jgi:hypothetical protein